VKGCYGKERAGIGQRGLVLARRGYNWSEKDCFRLVEGFYWPGEGCYGPREPRGLLASTDQERAFKFMG